MEKFIEASIISLSSIEIKESAQGMTFLLYMFGAVDMLCQVYKVEEKATLNLFENMLKLELGEYNSEEAKVVLRGVIQTSATTEGQKMLKEGAEAIRAWLTGGDVAAPHRLTEILMEKRR